MADQNGGKSNMTAMSQMSLSRRCEAGSVGMIGVKDQPSLVEDTRLISVSVYQPHYTLTSCCSVEGTRQIPSRQGFESWRVYLALPDR
jgi:hypothetical protein